MKLYARILSMLLVVLMTAGAMVTIPAAADTDVPIVFGGTPILHHEGGLDYADRKLTTHIYDFSVDSISYYATDRSVTYVGTPVLENGTVTTRAGHSFIFGSAICVGDEYGLEPGYVSFDLCRRSGAASLGIRTTKPGAASDKRGVWFDFGDGKVTVREPDSGMSVDVPVSFDLSETKTIRVTTAFDGLTMTCGGEAVLSVSYVRGGRLAVLDNTGKVLAEVQNNTVEPTGYFSLCLDELDGFADNIVFTTVTETLPARTSDSLRTIDYSTWTAADALGRTVSDSAAVGTPKANRDVGLFYFLCWVGAGVNVVDTTKLYAEGGIEGVRAHYAETVGESYWGEPFFGYYRNTDRWVYRKHAYQLEAAGVDFIFLDVSNNEVFIEGHMALFDTWLEMRREGIDTPQICFFNGDHADYFENNMKKLFTTVYSDENWDKYKELFYCWDGKPLVFGNIIGVSTPMRNKINEKFTVRGSWAWVDRNNYWSWMQEYVMAGSTARMKNGGWGRNAQGVYESLAVCLGHHATSSNGRSFVNGRQPNNGRNDYEFSSIERSAQGLCFANEYKAVQSLIDQNVSAEQPFCMLITGWNEWIAGGMRLEAAQSFCNGTADFLYVDNFNAEFSRDAEPMRNANGYGFGDNYYYQMVDIIRQYKGIAETPTADNQSTVSIYDLADWDKISMTYRDNIGDTAHRNTVSYDADYRYINNSGRNDLTDAKVSQDAYNLYFMVRTAYDVIVDDGAGWMNLFLNTDNDLSTGWNGFDYILNRDRDSFVVSVEKILDASFRTETVGGAYYAVQGDTMTVRLPKELVGLGGMETVSAMTFKWADNSVDTTRENPDPMDFIDTGDTAPDGRFSFVYKCDSCQTTAEKPVTLVTAAGKTTIRVQPTLPEKASAEIKLGSRNVDTMFDVENETAGIYVTDSALAEYFQHLGGTSASKVQILRGDNNNYMRMNGYSDLRTWNDVKGSYEISVDLHMIDTGNSAVYIRGEMPGSLNPVNPRNFNVHQIFNYFEWDWYAENGGRAFGGSSTAGSGIGIYPTDKGLIIRIKRYAPDGLTVASASHTFPYPASYEVGSDGWFNLHCVDDGTEAKIYCNETLICSVRMSGAGLTYESDGTGQEYYATAVMCDANGKEVLKVENTRLNSAGSQIALTTREQTMEFDNLYIMYTELLVEGNHVETEWKPSETEVDFTPDARLMTTLNLGAEHHPEADTGVVTEAQTEGETVETAAQSEADTDAAPSGCKSLMGLCLVPALTAFAVLPVLLRRREGD